MPNFSRRIFRQRQKADRPLELMHKLDWYHTIELEPGIYTPGKSYSNIALTRKILRGCEVENTTCLDVGTMDGLIAVLLDRRGAGRVVACDRYDRRAQIDTVVRSLGIHIDYLSGMSLEQVRHTAPHLIGDPFDLIVFSGVLYHMYDPMAGIGLLRSMIREGGIVIIETQLIYSAKMVSYFNATGKITSDIHEYWNLSVDLFDYILRYFRLKPLDCCYSLINGIAAEDDAQVLRVCVPCEAVPAALPDEGDFYMAAAGRDDDADFPVWQSRTTAPLAYTASASTLVRRASGAVNLYETISNTRPAAYTDDDVRLALGSRS